eukprot:s1579_g34.t2
MDSLGLCRTILKAKKAENLPRRTPPAAKCVVSTSKTKDTLHMLVIFGINPIFRLAQVKCQRRQRLQSRPVLSLASPSLASSPFCCPAEVLNGQPTDAGSGLYCAGSSQPWLVVSQHCCFCCLPLCCAVTQPADGDI